MAIPAVVGKVVLEVEVVQEVQLRGSTAQCTMQGLRVVIAEADAPTVVGVNALNDGDT